MKAKPVTPGRTVLTQNGMPKQVTLHMRQARSSPSRIKACFTIDHAGKDVPLPFAQAIVTNEGAPIPNKPGLPYAWTPEFRMEMN